MAVECGAAGECFFQSLARQLSLGGPYTQNHFDARNLRWIVDEQLKAMLMYQSRELYDAVGQDVFDNISAYVDRNEHLRDQDSADDYMISIIAAFLNINIRITNATDLAQQYTIGKDPNAHMVHLFYYPGVHYQSFELTADAPSSRTILGSGTTTIKTTATATFTRKRKATYKKHTIVSKQQK